MSGALPSTARRGPQKVSHLRHVSTSSSSDTTSNTSSRPVTSAGTAPEQTATVPPKAPFERRCLLWHHDDPFSRDEVVLNLDLFPEVRAGELMAAGALKSDSGVRDFQENIQPVKCDGEALSAAMQRDRSSSNPNSPGGLNSTHTSHCLDMEKRYLFIARDMSKEMKAKQPHLEISVTKHIADAFNLKPRSQVLITTTDPGNASASHVELSFKDEYLSRSDMWRMALGELANKTVYRGQKILFMGTIKARVTAIYIAGRKVQSAFYSTNTKPVFRSESARYVLFIQMSREMWDFDSEGSGEIMFNKVVNGFLPTLFKKWVSLEVKHLVSIVLFTRVEYDTGITSELATATYDTSYHTGTQPEGSKKPYKDFYRVVVSEMSSGSWTTILYQLKREFRFFLRDISLHRIKYMNKLENGSGESLGARRDAEPSLAMHGNVLEAINLACTTFAQDYIDRDLMRTGISVVVITPSPGLFEVDYETLRMTTETLIGNGIGIDLVCLPKMPLHSVPLFRYRNPEYGTYQEALHFRSFRSEESTPRQSSAFLGSSYSSINESLSPIKVSHQDRSVRIGSFSTSPPPSEWSYAIPHWIDVSFWTGALQDVHLGHPARKATSITSMNGSTERPQDFGIRCKMYEMEMASVMQNVLSEIAVAPLQHHPLFPRMVVGTREVLGVKQQIVDTFGSLGREKVLGSLLEVVGGPAKTHFNRNSSPEEKTLFKAVDKLDVAISEVSVDVSGVRQNEESRKLFKSGSGETVRKVLAEDSKIFGTSFDDGGIIPKAINPLVMPHPSMVNNQNSKSGSDFVKPRKDSASSSMTVKASPVRAPKLGRQISLGKFGFGIAAPKAAIAEIQTEHVSATRLANRSLDRKKSTGNTMASHLLGTTTQDRPTSSHSDKSKPSKSETPPREQKVESVDSPRSQSRRPMTIKSALQSLDSTNQFKSRSMLGSVYEHTDSYNEGSNNNILQSMKFNDSQKLFNSKLLAESVPELPSTLSPTTALSPWLTVLNPSNPTANDLNGPSQYRRWQHVFPRPVYTHTMKWKSLCCPASVPLTTEYFPTKQQLDTEYQQKPYNVSQECDDELNENPQSRDELLRELVALRLSHGFQIVLGSAVARAFGQKYMKTANVFDPRDIAEDGVSVFMSMGNIIHQLSCVNETEVEVNMFVRKPTASTTSSPGAVVPSVYNPAIRTTLSDYYESRQIVLGKPGEEYNWNYVDSFIAGFDDEMSESLRFWRARYVLIPVERPTQSQRVHQGEDNEEEVRLEGIKRLTQTWQRHRIISTSERRFQSLAARKSKDQNPLDIVYKTEDPSVVVTAELETLPLVETGDMGGRRGQLLETERFRQSKLDIGALAEAIQAPVERGGVRMQNRRWHFRLHYNCFIGSDMTTWLIENFADIETREQAITLGNWLMAKDDLQRIREREISKDNGKEKEKDKETGIFVHVEKRHPFRDGQYFYQVTGEFAKQRPESRSGWFGSRRRDASVPSTPMSESMPRESPRPEKSRSSSNHDEKSSDSGTTTPTTAGGMGGKRPKVSLSKVMKYDVDHRKRSYRPERINLHYDRLHNPDGCYHIRIDWMSVTAKLIEDAIESWARTAEGYGLRLIEAPISEACSISSSHPFRSPYIIELTRQPPDQQPRTYFDIISFTPQIQASPSSRHYYQKAIMKKFNFVLDIEAARNFPSNVDVTYSWGRPDYKYTQYIHRSGVMLAQITDEGNFLLLANRLYNNRTAAARELERYVKIDHEKNNRIPSVMYGHGLNIDRPTPPDSPMIRSTSFLSSPVLRATSDVLGPSLAGSKFANSITPDTIKLELESFCHNTALLDVFYKEVLERATPPSATPPSLKSPRVGSLLDSHIPTLGLPPGVLARDSSPSPMRLSNMSGVGSSIPQLGRRPSVQTGYSGEPLRQDSPRGSIGDGDKAF
ncbi:vacuolar membrane-associated protein-like protein IML1 [Amylocarpus encephaloides]|uniref:Vacuolar membrane-associated protein IML1 n=1 Tax=Amylocarpus encephaloides TaxID=45428 RepID=A0A9P8C948_9HELO|nr:vacuolar membrane-associated protein-like protein IML1 [Amylocarpus encephaloides]